jgi:hypothetical protein
VTGEAFAEYIDWRAEHPFDDFMPELLHADHPDQRRQLAEDRSLIPNAIEEILRYEPPAPHVARYVARDVEHHGLTVPEGVDLTNARLAPTSTVRGWDTLPVITP